MKLLFGLLLLIAVVSAAPTAQQDDRPTRPLILQGRMRLLMADELKAYHQERRKIHKDYIPSYPDLPVLVDLTVGTPEVDYEVSLETGSEAVFLLAKDYAGLDPFQQSFDPAQSSTAQFAGDYRAFSGELEVTGSTYDDVIGMFGFGMMVNTTQRFGVVSNVYDPYILNPKMPDGVLGLSWDPKDAKNPNENSSAIINFFKEFHEFDRYYCEWIEAKEMPTHEVPGREYALSASFGFCLEDVCAPMTPERTYPLVWFEDTRSLAFAVDSVGYKGQRFDGDYAKVDTGVPNVLLPQAIFLALFADVQPTFDFDYGVYTLDCKQAEKLPDWEVVIGGYSYAIPSSSYVVDLWLPDGQCVWSAKNSDAETTPFVFGYIFHTLWCIKMDVNQQTIGFSSALLPPTTVPPADAPASGEN